MQAALLVACTAAAAVSASASTHNAWAENTSTNDAGHKIRQSPKNIEPRTLWYFVRAAKSVLSLMAGAVVKNKAAQNAPLLFVFVQKQFYLQHFASLSDAGCTMVQIGMKQKQSSSHQPTPQHRHRHLFPPTARSPGSCHDGGMLRTAPMNLGKWHHNKTLSMTLSIYIQESKTWSESK